MNDKGINIRGSIPLNKKNKKIVSAYNPDCKLTPSNILKAFIKTKKLKIVKKIDILPKAKVLFKIVDLKK